MNGEELLEKMGLADPAYVAAADRPPRKRKHGWVKYGIAAACLGLVLLASLLGMPGPANTFAVKAYALEEQADGTIGLKETDLLHQPDVWGGYYDGEYLYISVGLRYEGENIESVTFTTEEGFFAKQSISALSTGENVGRMYVGADNTLVLVGTEFEIVGSQVTLSGETMTDDLLLFWGMESETGAHPNKLEMTAVATFRDGRTQEVPISVDLSSGAGLALFRKSPLSEEEQQEAQQQGAETYAYYQSLPLEDCELIEDSVEAVTDVYEVPLGSVVTSIITLNENMEFDEDGIWRGGPATSSDQVYIPVIRRNADGTYTGMVYRVPEELQYPQ